MARPFKMSDITIEDEDPTRGEVRPDEVSKAEDPREVAARRTAEILGQLDGALEGRDEFYIPPELKDPDWDYNWKKWTVFNQEDPSYMSSVQATGWEFVSAKDKRYKRYLPRNWKEAFVLQKGMVLMKRPQAISDIVDKRQKREAKQNVETVAEIQAGKALPTGFESHNNGQPIRSHGVSGAKRTIEGSIPEH